MRVAVRRHRGALLERGGIGGPQARGELGRQVDVHQAGDAVAPEEDAAPLRAPDDARLDGRAGLHLLIRPDLDAGMDHRALADDGPVADHGALKDDGLALQAALPPDDGPVEFHALTDVAVPPHDAAFEVSVRVHHGIVAHHRGTVDDDPALDLDPVAEKDGAVQLGIRGDVHILAAPERRAPLGAQGLHPHAPLEQIVRSAHVLGEVADVAPVAAGDVAVHRVAAPHQEREEILGKVKVHARLEMAEDLGLQHIDAGVHRIGDDLAPGGLFLELGDAALVVQDDDAVLERVGHAVEGQGGQRPLLAVVLDHRAEVDVGHGVPADHEEGIVQQRLGLLDAAGGAERGLFDAVGDVHAHGRAVPEKVLDVLGHVLQGDDDIDHPVPLQEIEDVADNGLVHHRDHGLGAVQSEGTQPRAGSTGHYHCFHGALLHAYRARVPVDEAEDEVIAESLRGATS